MYRLAVLMGILIFGLAQAAVAADSSNSGDKKGITIDDYARGLKSAANSVEKEIPKMGSAIGRGFKKITEKSPEKSSSQESTKQSK